MRRRRADRCVLRASAALDADVREAKDLLDEARAVCPAHPEIQGLTNRLRSQLLECDRPPALPWLTAALVALLGTGAGWGGVWVLVTPQGAAALERLVTIVTYAAESATHVAIPQVF